MMRQHIIVPNRILTVESFFSKEECEQYIQASENIGFDAASVTTTSGQAMMPEIRNNSRVNIEDAQLAETLWQRIKPFVPSPLFRREAIGLNERWRFYRYDAGQTFKMHHDGSVKRDNGERSQVTFMIYLNQDSEGGETRFELPGSQEIITVAPRSGMALLFLHSLRHEGAPVLSGRKYVLRSDVMYSVAQEP
jgi:predicted 2-oxoglutarate/Fe(II)-dependent dioxygenase YbiX